jgi:hypothetical protein
MHHVFNSHSAAHHPPPFSLSLSSSHSLREQAAWQEAEGIRAERAMRRLRRQRRLERGDDAEEDDGGGSIKLGLGDFVFYSVLVARCVWAACGLRVGCVWAACGLRVGCVWAACGLLLPLPLFFQLLSNPSPPFPPFLLIRAATYGFATLSACVLVVEIGLGGTLVRTARIAPLAIR